VSTKAVEEKIPELALDDEDTHLSKNTTMIIKTIRRRRIKKSIQLTSKNSEARALNELSKDARKGQDEKIKEKTSQEKVPALLGNPSQAPKPVPKKKSKLERPGPDRARKAGREPKERR